MSYDLVAYDPRITFTGTADFLTWYKKQIEWSEDHGYDNPEVSTAELRSWFMELIIRFPPMNGPLANEENCDSHVTDYSIGKSLIYAAFAWSVSQEAHVFMQELAKRHRIGFFDITNDDVWGISNNEYKILFKTA